MIKKWFLMINLGIGSIAATLLLISGFFLLISSEEVVVADLPENKRILPSNSFSMPKQACESIGTGCLDLKFVPMTMQLPDLRTHLTFQSRNGRPDAKIDRVLLHFAFNGNQTATPIVAGERRYVIYDRTKTPAQYLFSPDNVETALWIEPLLEGNETVVNVRMKGENGDILREPPAYAQFRLTEKEASRGAGKAWEIGKWRVDGSLLARQKASWKGQDLFLNRHGGEEFVSFLDKHRIDFTDEETSYSVYVGVADLLIWDNDQWETATAEKNTLDYPLLLVKKIDERLMNLELWDVGGKNKVILNLVKMNDAWAPDTLKQNFKCLGARTRSQYIFEINEERVLLSPQDWLLQTEEGWVKLSTPEEVDQYVERKKTGVLFVFDGVEKIESNQVLTGVMFNSSRTEMKEIEIPVKKKGSVSQAKNQNIKDDDYDEDFHELELSDDDDEDDEEGDETVKIKQRSAHRRS